MPLLNIVIVLIVIGALLWLLNTYLDFIDPKIKKIINIVVVIVVVIWLLRVFGVFSYADTIRI